MAPSLPGDQAAVLLARVVELQARLERARMAIEDALAALDEPE